MSAWAIRSVVRCLRFEIIVPCCFVVACFGIRSTAWPDESDPIGQALTACMEATIAGDHEKAARAAMELTSRAEAKHGVKADKTAWTYVMQVECQTALGNGREARRTRGIADEILSRRTQERTAEQAAAYCTLASCSVALGDLGVAEDLAHKALATYEAGESDILVQIAQVMTEIASEHQSQKRPAAADQFFKAALHALNAYTGAPHGACISSLNAAARFYQEQRRYGDAVNLYEAAASVAEKVDGISPVVSAMCLAEASHCRIILGQLATAEELSRKALAVTVKATNSNSEEAGIVKASLAKACCARGKWDEAFSLATQAVDIADKTHGADSPRACEARRPLVEMYCCQGRYREAEALLRKSLSSLTPLVASGDTEYLHEFLFCGDTLASTLIELEDLENADRTLDMVYEVSVRHFGPDSEQAARVLDGYAAICLQRGQVEKAEALYRQCLKGVQRKGEGHSASIARKRIRLALTQAVQGKCREASENVDRGLRSMVWHLRENLAGLPTAEQTRLLREQYSFVSTLPLTIGALLAREPQMRELSATWLCNSKALAHEATITHRRDYGRSREDGEEQYWVELEQARAGIPKHAVFVDIARIGILDFKPNAKQMEKNIEHSMYAAWIVPPPGEGSIQVVDLGQALAVEAAVVRYRDALRGALGEHGTIAMGGELKAEQSLRKAARPLAQEVLSPILAGIKASGCMPAVEEMIISPDGELWLVPWAALPLDEERFLVEQYAISTVTSARDLLVRDSVRQQCSRPLIFADPLFDLPMEMLEQAVTAAANDTPVEALSGGHASDVAESKFSVRSASDVGRASRLYGSLNEARRVAEALEKMTKEKPMQFVQARALEERVKKVRSPRVLHFATHGFVLPDQAAAVEDWAASRVPKGFSIQGLTSKEGIPLEDPLLRCGLLLTGCNAAAEARPKGAEDGCLTGKEIGSLNLWGTELVVLSACDTGVGRIQYGEGVAGLRQAFLLAGADAVLATLWQVPDAPTADLVAGFFDHLAAGKSKASALRQAQRDLIEKRRKANGAAHPAAWAAFELTGR
jgi:CHAT domain-containing protein